MKAVTASVFLCTPSMTEYFTTKIGAGEHLAFTAKGHKVGEQQQQISVLHAMLGDPTLGPAPITPVMPN